MRLSLLELHSKQEQRFIEQVAIMESKWREKLRAQEELYRVKELEYRSYDKEVLGRLFHDGYEEIERLKETNREQWLEARDARQRHKLLEKELRKMKSEMEAAQLETDYRLEMATKVKQEWVGPLIQGGLGLGKPMYPS